MEKSPKKRVKSAENGDFIPKTRHCRSGGIGRHDGFKTLFAYTLQRQKPTHNPRKTIVLLGVFLIPVT